MKKILLAVAFAVSISAQAIKDVTPDEAAKIIKENKDVVVLDVRTPDEFKAGHIKGATNINFQDKDFAKRIAALDKSKTYVIHCAAGGRSGRACAQIKDMKFEKMFHLKAGMSGWEEAGKPVEK
jgi:phage shock protein E